ncbi:unnamed protein product [Arabidopsis halleri]
MKKNIVTTQLFKPDNAFLFFPVYTALLIERHINTRSRRPLADFLLIYLVLFLFYRKESLFCLSQLLDLFAIRRLSISIVFCFFLTQLLAYDSNLIAFAASNNASSSWIGTLNSHSTSSLSWTNVF